MLCHLLGPGGRQEEELKTALDQLALPNVWFDLSSVVHNCRDVQDPWNRAAEYVRLARDLAGAHKLMFGTDAPSALKEAQYSDYVRWMLEMDGLSCGEKEQIMYKNADLVYTGQ